MMRSLFSGVSGLKNHQTRMDVIGNNISNVNTYGFKSSRVTFQDMLSQTIAGAAKPEENKGGINPKQVGLGMTVASIDRIFTQGSLQTTGNQTDLAISGDGFFQRLSHPGKSAIHVDPVIRITDGSVQLGKVLPVFGEDRLQPLDPCQYVLIADHVNTPIAGPAYAPGHPITATVHRRPAPV